jgi:hypothetical protein
MHLAYAPILLGSGERLWDDLDQAPDGYEIADFVGRRRLCMSGSCGRLDP